jgi:hypothetical protein
MERNNDGTSFSLRSLQRDFKAQYRKRNWKRVEVSLRELVSLCENFAQKELSLLAQSMIEVLSIQASDDFEPNSRIDELFNQICLQLSHFEWLIRSRLNPGNNPGVQA